jgi:antibiotic biosynthesis monooxygenase (ABM) superfamily enzyme
MTIVMPFLNYLFLALLYAVTAIPYNLAQWGVNVVVAVALYPVVIRIQKVSHFEELR